MVYLEVITVTIHVIDGFVNLLSLIASISLFLAIRWVIGTVT